MLPAERSGAAGAAQTAFALIRKSGGDEPGAHMSNKSPYDVNKIFERLYEHFVAVMTFTRSIGRLTVMYGGPYCRRKEPTGATQAHRCVRSSGGLLSRIRNRQLLQCCLQRGRRTAPPSFASHLRCSLWCVADATREHLFWQTQPVALNKSKHRIPLYNVGSHFICKDLGRAFPHAFECPKRLNLEFSRGDDSPPLFK